MEDLETGDGLDPVIQPRFHSNLNLIVDGKPAYPGEQLTGAPADHRPIAVCRDTANEPAPWKAAQSRSNRRSAEVDILAGHGPALCSEQRQSRHPTGSLGVIKLVHLSGSFVEAMVLVNLIPVDLYS